MPMLKWKKSIFSASFEESLRIQSAYKKYIVKAHQNTGMVNTIFTALLAIGFFGTLSYILGVGMPTALSNSSPEGIQILSDVNIRTASRFALWFSDIPKIFAVLWVVYWLLYIIRRFLPGWSLLPYVRFGFLGGTLLSLLLLCVLGPITLGLALTGIGWIGLIFQILIVVLIGEVLIKATYRKICIDLFGEVSSTKRNINFFKLILAGILILSINSFSLRIGFIQKSEMDIWSLIYSWLFLVIGLFTIYSVKVLIVKNGVSTFYFLKYPDQYRKAWKLTDEQWYGKRKAKRLARKKLKELQKEKRK